MDKLIKHARTWIGTPFKHQGRVKGLGCDCLGLIIGLSDELKLKVDGRPLSLVDNPVYSMTPNTKELLIKLEKYLTNVNISDMKVGDIALIDFQENPQHLAIISDYPYGGFALIHSISAGAEGVVEHRLTDGWKKRILKVYRIKPEYF